MKKAIILEKTDNVATALENIISDEQVVFINKNGDTIGNILSLDNINAGHKIAIKNINKNDLVIKYGCPIGIASNNIGAGKLAHVNNIESRRGRGDLC